MGTFSRMPRYDIRNDGAGPYAIFYCDACGREYRSQPDLANSVKTDIGRSVVGGLFRNIPLVGSVAENVAGQDPRYSHQLTGPQLEKAWQQAQVNFGECPTCRRIVCLSDFDAQSGLCAEDSPRSQQIDEARGAQAGAAIKGFAAAFGLGDALDRAKQAAEESQRQAKAGVARCPTDGTMAPAGTKFCPNCGTAMVQPPPAASTVCPKCGTDTHGAKFCPNCGNKMEQAPVVAPATCPNCGVETKGAKFCPNCGTKVG
jgi:ribosomal protein L32